ncbi:hypothetical protein QR680_014709 [Steinernema hermaphroditum]|uniref:Uncharacterized protein n=1 Tax=Steinernema hermaphroditum TaxID=289476 RepID=A0AA39IBB9_9BILA|nr:hypothetical protein QR680_014709 [Steinernema hermaphroditum]
MMFLEKTARKFQTSNGCRANTDPDRSRLRPFQKLIERLGSAREYVPKPDWVEADAISLDAWLFGFEFDSKCVVSHHDYDEIVAGLRTAAFEGDLEMALGLGGC